MTTYDFIVGIVILVVVFSLVLGAVILLFRVRKLCKTDWEYYNKGKIVLFYIAFALVILTGIRHLNPLRWPERAIRVVVLNFITPVGTTWDEVHQRIDVIPGWSPHSVSALRRYDFEPGRSTRRADHFHPRTSYFIPPPEGSYVFIEIDTILAELGSYRIMFFFKKGVTARWIFDVDGRVIDLVISKQAHI